MLTPEQEAQLKSLMAEGKEEEAENLYKDFLQEYRTTATHNFKINYEV